MSFRTNADNTDGNLNDQVHMPSSGGDLTFMGWFKLSTAPDYVPLLSLAQAGGAFQVMTAGGVLELRVAGVGVQAGTTPLTPLLGMWMHVAVVRTRAAPYTWSLYLNGALEATYNHDPGSDPSYWFWGNFGYTANDYLFAQLRVFTTGMSLAQIAAEQSSGAAVDTADLWYANDGKALSGADQGSGGRDEVFGQVVHTVVTLSIDDPSFAPPVPPTPRSPTDPVGLTSARLARIIDGLKSGAVLNIAADPYGADPTGLTDSYPAIQAALDDAAAAINASNNSGRPPVGYPLTISGPPGSYSISRPLRMKIGGMRLVMGDDWRSAEFAPTYHGGPTLALYPQLSGYGPIKTTTALLTGAGAAWQITCPISGWATRAPMWINIRLDSYEAEFNGLAQFCAEHTFKLLSVPTLAVGYGMFHASAGLRCAGDVPTQAYFLAVDSDGHLVGGMTVGGVYTVLTGTTVISTGVNHHCAISYDGSNIRLLLDGAVEATQAATGTVTQSRFEDVDIGAGGPGTNWPDSTPAYGGADAVIDGVRFSNVARYTGAYSVPTAKWSLDANTLIVFNFDDVYDAFIVGHTNAGDCHCFVRFAEANQDNVEIPYGMSGVTIKNFFINGMSGGSGGIISTRGYEQSWERIFVFTQKYGIHLWNNCFSSHFTRVKAELYSSLGQFSFCANAQEGLTYLDDAVFAGGAAVMIIKGGSVVAHQLWLQTGNDSVVDLIVSDSGSSAVLVGPVWDMEASLGLGWTPPYAEVLLGGGGSVTILGGEFEWGTKDDAHWPYPIVVNDNLSTVALYNPIFIGASPTAGDPGPAHALIHCAAPPLVYPITVVGGRKTFANQFVPSTSPWCDASDSIVTLTDARLRPTVGGCRILDLTGGTTPVLDAGQTNRFTLRAHDASAYAIPAFIKARPGEPLWITVENDSGGALGALTWSIMYGMNAWVSPDDAKATTIAFSYNGLNYMETSRVSNILIPKAQPTDLSGLQFWVKADQIIGLVDGDPVSAWDDQSANAYNLAPHVEPGATNPVYKTNVLNGLPAVRFDGTPAFFMTGDSVPNLDGETFTVLMVGKLHAGQGWAFLTKTDLNNGARFALVTDNYGTVCAVSGRIMTSTQQGSVLSTITWPYDTYRMAVLRLDSLLNATLLVDGASAAQKVMDSAPPAPPGVPTDHVTNFFVGSGGWTNSGLYLNGDICEVIVFNRALGDDELQLLQQYLSKKYGVNLNSAGC